MLAVEIRVCPLLQYLKDPDITASYILLLGKRIPVMWGKRHWGKLPYHLQQYYFFFSTYSHMC